MIERLYPLLEIVAIIYCLHGIYDKKISLKLSTVFLILGDMILLECVNHYSADPVWSLVTYWLIAIYILIEFPCNLRGFIIGNMLYVMIIGVLQLTVVMFLLVFKVDVLSDEVRLFILNMIVLLIQIPLYKYYRRFFRLLLKKNSLSGFIGVLYFLILFQKIFQYKKKLQIDIEQVLTLCIFGILFMIVLYCWQKEKEKSYQKEMDLKLHEVYDHSFREMIDAIRKRQHEFNNHMQAILCMHYTIGTYEELICEQEKYCHTMVDNNKFYHLLSGNWPVLSGFLYGKFQEADSKGIQVIYEFQVGKKSEKLPEYVLIEILGILLDNAIEAASEIDSPMLRVYVIEKEKLEIYIGNPAEQLQNQDISAWFTKGYSSKSGHTGLGLSKLEEYQVQYGFERRTLLVEFENRKWIAITLTI